MIWIIEIVLYVRMYFLVLQNFAHIDSINTRVTN